MTHMMQKTVILFVTCEREQQHFGNGDFLLVDAQDVLEDERAWFVAGMDNQATAAKKQILEHVVDFLADAQVWS